MGGNGKKGTSGKTQSSGKGGGSIPAPKYNVKGVGSPKRSK